MNQLQISFQIVYFTFTISALVQSIRVTLENHQRGVALKNVTLGDTNVELICKAHFRLLVTWTFRTSRFVGSELLIIERNDLFPSSISHRYEVSGTNLIIKKIEQRDAGLYECRFEDPNENRVGRGEYTLIVRPPSTTNTTTMSITANATTTSNTTKAPTSNTTADTILALATSTTAEATNLTTFEAIVSVRAIVQLIAIVVGSLIPVLLAACVILLKKIKNWNQIVSSNSKWQTLTVDDEIAGKHFNEEDAV